MRTGTAIGFRVSHELCSNFLLYSVYSIHWLDCVVLLSVGSMVACMVAYNGRIFENWSKYYFDASMTNFGGLGFLTSLCHWDKVKFLTFVLRYSLRCRCFVVTARILITRI